MDPLSYRDYAMLLTVLDPEWTRVPSGAEDTSHWVFRRGCAAFGSGIQKKYARFCKANEAGRDEYGPDLERCLYNPMHYRQLSGGGDAAITLVDDHDAPHHLTMRVHNRLRDACLAYCPQVQSYAPKGNPLFAELDALFSPSFGPRPGDETDDAGERRLPRRGPPQRLPVHRQQRRAPLMLMSRLKLDGLCALGKSLSCQRAVYRAMASRLAILLDELREMPRKQMEALDIRHSDLDTEAGNLRCVFLDLLSAEEIGLMVFCRNFSVAMAFVAGLRTLRLRDLLTACPDLAPALSREPLHRFIVGHIRKRRTPGRYDYPIEELADNHVFRWSWSSLFVSPGQFSGTRGTDFRHCHGTLYPTIGFELSPGHRHRAFLKIREIQRTGHAVVPEDDARFLKFPVGTVDWVLSPEEIGVVAVPRKSRDGGVRNTAPLSIREFVEATDRLRNTFRLHGLESDEPLEGRDVIDFRAGFSVDVAPCPTLLETGRMDEGHAHVAAFCDFSYRLVRQLCPSLPASPAEQPMPTEGLHRLSIAHLFNHQVEAGIPVYLRRTIERLFQTYYMTLCDPLRFDMVLDLYDSFAALHRAITKSLAEQGRRIHAATGRYTVITERQVRELASAYLQ